MSLINDLKKVGLNEKEAKVYLAVLELGRGAVQEIALRSSIKRSTAYVILEGLIKSGLCGTVDDNNKTYYTASDPEAIKNMIELEKKTIDERLDYFDKIKENLDLLNNQSRKNKPMVSFYEGEQNVYNSSLEVSKAAIGGQETINSIYPLDKLKELLNDQKFTASRQKSRQKRLKAGIKAEVIGSSAKLKEFSDTLDTYRVVDAGKFPIEADINIAGDITRIAIWEDKQSAILIRDKHVARTLKTLFKLAWLGVESLKEKK